LLSPREHFQAKAQAAFSEGALSHKALENALSRPSSLKGLKAGPYHEALKGLDCPSRLKISGRPSSKSSRALKGPVPQAQKGLLRPARALYGPYMVLTRPYISLMMPLESLIMPLRALEGILGFII
jgi:hypothetical protein